MDVFDFGPLVAVAAMIWTALSVIKLVRGKQYGDALTIALLVGVGIGAAFLLAASDFGPNIEVAGLALASLNAASLCLVGYAFSASARALYEVVTTTRTGREPKLFANMNHPDPR